MAVLPCFIRPILKPHQQVFTLRGKDAEEEIEDGARRSQAMQKRVKETWSERERGRESRREAERDRERERESE